MLARVRERLADRRLGDLAEGHPTRLVARARGRPRRRARRWPRPRGRGRWRGRPRRRPFAACSIVVDLLAPVVGHDVLGLEVVVDVHPELALAGVLRQVADVAVRGEDAVVRAEVALDRPRLGRRLDDHQVLWHGRESSTARCTDGLSTRTRSPERAGSRPLFGVASGVADAAQEVLVDLGVSSSSIGLGDPRLDRHALPRPGPQRQVPAPGGRRQDLDEPQVEHREEEDRVQVVDEDRLGSRSASARSCSGAGRRRPRAARTGRPAAVARC